jgi:hypothetical protein
MVRGEKRDGDVKKTTVGYTIFIRVQNTHRISSVFHSTFFILSVNSFRKNQSKMWRNYITF